MFRLGIIMKADIRVLGMMEFSPIRSVWLGCMGCDSWLGPDLYRLELNFPLFWKFCCHLKVHPRLWTSCSLIIGQITILACLVTKKYMSRLMVSLTEFLSDLERRW